MSEKYDIEEIKKLRLKGYTIEQVGNYFGVNKSTISVYLKRKYNIVFWKLPKKCRYCNKIFKPKRINYQFCSEECRYYHTLERVGRNFNNYYKRLPIKLRKPDIHRENPFFVYKDALNFLNTKKENSVCPLCGNDDENEFEICRGEIICKKCQLVQE